MLPKDKLEEIKHYLLHSTNPLFFFDDDADGLCSFLLLRRFIGFGKGIVVKNSPSLNMKFLPYIQKYNPDIIFVLDKPYIDQELINKAKRRVIWIDHHTPSKREGVKYYNPREYNSKAYIPTSYLCYKTINKDLWIAIIGIVGDYLIPPFLKDFKEQYPELVKNEKTPGDILFKTNLGRLIRIFSFMLKGKTKDVNNNIDILLKINSPYEILDQETENGKQLYKVFSKINKKYESLLEKAIESATNDKILLFTYISSISFSREISTELSYKFPKKIIIVGRIKDEEISLSLRSKRLNIQKRLEKALVGINGYGGGHEKACGANIKKDDFNKFISNFKKLCS